ncbi:MAG: FAD-binding protein [Candidatus Marinimicrobia bacterium]|nr:FAD-binding protein [Candidatus Neomarinimicrobiota bacterium]
MNSKTHKTQEFLTTDTITRQLYSTAACIYEILPTAVAIPKNITEIESVFQFACDNSLSITPRGAGSSLAGQAIGDGIILDLTHFRKIKMLENNRVRVEPGVVYADLNRFLSEYGLFFPPDPSSGKWCTIGGMLGNNSSGAHSLQYGATKKYVHSLEILLADGTKINLKRGKRAEISDQMHEKLATILNENREIIENNQPKTTRTSSGYDVKSLLESDDLVDLFIGSEGTLGTILSAELDVVLIPKFRKTALFYFETLENSANAVKDLLPFSPSACEFMDHFFIGLTLKSKPKLKSLIPENTKFMLLCDFDGDDETELENRLKNASDLLMKNGKSSGFKIAQTDVECDILWDIRRAALAVLNQWKGIAKPVPFIEDVTVSPECLAEFLSRAYSIFEKYEATTAAFGHAGEGNLHLRPILNLRNSDDVTKMEQIADKIYGLVSEFSGSFTGEHGDGILRASFTQKYHPEMFRIFGEIKKNFDPENRMNLGKIWAENPQKISENLRFGDNYSRQKTETKFDENHLISQIELCHGCGQCRDYCPSFSASLDEFATARAKANVLRGMVSGKLNLSDLLEKSDIFDACIHCNGCWVDCPTGVDIPKLAVEFKTLKHTQIPLKNKFLFNTKLVSELGVNFAPFSNLLARSVTGKWFAEKMFGVDRRMEIQKFRRNAISEKVFAHRSKQQGRKVALFTGCHGTYSDTSELKSTVQLLEKLDVQVKFPFWRCCGVAKFSSGLQEEILDDAQFNTETLNSYIERGYDVVFTAASCGMMLKNEYPNLLKTEESKRVSDNILDIFLYLQKLYVDGQFRGEFLPISEKIIYHEPCHRRAVGTGDAVRFFLQKIPELEILEIEDHCCGMAGTFGYKNYDFAKDIGTPLFEEISRVNPQKILSDCGTCQVQIAQHSKKNTQHPIEIVNRSYHP